MMAVSSPDRSRPLTDLRICFPSVNKKKKEGRNKLILNSNIS
jgi:hypothetical protein